MEIDGGGDNNSSMQRDLQQPKHYQYSTGNRISTRVFSPSTYLNRSPPSLTFQRASSLVTPCHSVGKLGNSNLLVFFFEKLVTWRFDGEEMCDQWKPADNIRGPQQVGPAHGPTLAIALVSSQPTKHIHRAFVLFLCQVFPAT